MTGIGGKLWGHLVAGWKIVGTRKVQRNAGVGGSMLVKLETDVKKDKTPYCQTV